MKIRIKGDSIRYRLTKSEVERFADEGIIKEETHFGDRVLTYALVRNNTPVISAEFSGDSIIVAMPAAMAAEWTATERVGFENTDNALSIFIEKDFKCLDNVAEDQSDNYPNPLAVHSHDED